MMKNNMKSILRTAYYGLQTSLNVAAYYLLAHRCNCRRLKAAKDCCKGRRCFVVCNGPSLRIEDLTRIHAAGDVSIGINLIGRVCERTPWRPDYLVQVDGINYVKSNRAVAEVCECGCRIYDHEHYLICRHTCGEKVYLRRNGDRRLLDHPRWGDDLTRPVPSIGTSTYICLQWAAWIGCKEIYIIGCDMGYRVNLHRDGTITYNEAGQDHFYTSAASAPTSLPEKPYPIWEMETAFEAAATFATERGLHIYNATRGGHLEAFPRIDFDTLF